MNPRTIRSVTNRSFRRTIAALLPVALLLAVSAVLAQAAVAQPPTKVHVTTSGSSTLAAGTLCSFPVTLDGTLTFTSTTFYDSDGVITKRVTEGTEQDAFSANGKTLVGDPYHFNFIRDFVNGVSVSFYGTGLAALVHLPAGGTYVVAGRVNPLEGAPIMTVDSGKSGTNLDAFCAALS